VALAMCPLCSDDEDIYVVRTLDDGRKLVECRRCNYQWKHGEPTAAPATTKAAFSFDEVKARFPKPDDVAPKILARADRLKSDFLRHSTGAAPAIAPYWTKYQQAFSRQGLWECDPKLLKDFANSDIGAHPGNQATFNKAWNAMGDTAAAESTRKTIDYLLYGPDAVPLEDRLHHLLTGQKSFSMTGFKEALLTKVLCVMQPDRFLLILKYTTEAGGKREIARSIYRLELPAPESVNWTLGRLILWSNDILLALAADGFANQQHAAAFLWWAKDQPHDGQPVLVDGGA
jgi:hypothetical protein